MNPLDRPRPNSQLTENQATRMRAWIQALRSGPYIQAQQRLRTPILVDGKMVTGYCCLGVAADIAIKNGCPIEWAGDAIRSTGPVELLSASLLVDPLTRWFGFSSNYAAIEVPCHILGRDRGSRNPCSTFFAYGRHDGPDCTRPAFVEATSLNDHYRWTFGQIADAFENFYFPAVSDGE